MVLLNKQSATLYYIFNYLLQAPPSESLENESSLPDAEAAVSADSMDSCDLQVYLDKAAQRIQLMNGEDSEDDSELDPDLVAELAGLDLETPS